jgi:hypothetical protein
VFKTALGKYFPFILILFCCLAAVYLGTIPNPRGNTGGGGIDTAGIDRAAGIADDIGNRVSGLEGAIVESRDRIDRSRGIVTGSIPLVGEIGSGLSTITGRAREAQERVSRIEESCYRIEQALGAIRAQNKVLEDNGD